MHSTADILKHAHQCDSLQRLLSQVCVDMQAITADLGRNDVLVAALIASSKQA